MEKRSLSIELTAAEWAWLEQYPNPDPRHWELADRIAYVIRCKMQECPIPTQETTYDFKRSADY